MVTNTAAAPVLTHTLMTAVLSLPPPLPHPHSQEYLQDLAELPETPWSLKGLAQVYTAQGPAAAESLKQVGDHQGSGSGS
jgi:hypothetical protein